MLSGPYRKVMAALLSNIDYIKLGNDIFKGIIELQDGTRLDVNDSGGVKVDTSDQRHSISYKACDIREFNRFINASDLLVDFMKYMGKHDCTQEQFMALPIELFINWLVIRAAQQDGDPVPADVVDPAVSMATKQPPAIPAPDTQRNAPTGHCRCCGRFTSKAMQQQGLPYCGEACVVVFMRKNQLSIGA